MNIMKKLLLSYLLAVGAYLVVGMTSRAEEPAGTPRSTSKSRADRPPRKVVVGTVIFGPYGKYPGLEERLKVLSKLVDDMADEAGRTYPGRRLDLAVLPETSVTDNQGPATHRAIPLRGSVLETFGALARRHKTYLVVPLDLVEEGSSGPVYFNSAVLLDRQGAVAGIYRKVHPVAVVGRDDLENGISPGSEFPVFDCDFGKLGIQICWDMTFDDGWQALADKGAELVVWPSASPATALSAARAGRHRYYVVSSCWRNNATIYEPTGLVAARVESPGKPLVHQIDLSYAVLGWSAHLHDGKAFRDKYGDRAGYHYEPGKTSVCSGPTIPPRRSGKWSERWASRRSTCRSRATDGCKTRREAGLHDDAIWGSTMRVEPRFGEMSVFGFFKRRRRDHLRSAPFPPAWRAIIEKNVPFHAFLPEADRRELQGLVQVFLAEKNFEGCGGLELNDEIKVTIAAQACVLLLHRETNIFPRLTSILVYPSAYVAKAVEPIGGGVVLEGEQVRLGEAWKDGVAIVSWDDVRATALGHNYGKNLVLHEFAHLLDMEDGAADGTPILERRDQYEAWVRILGEEYERLRRDSTFDRYTALDTYGATNSAEFFAVATEAFFEKPGVLQKRHPELYEELKSFYRQDPARLLPFGASPLAPGEDTDLIKHPNFMASWAFSADPARWWRIAPYLCSGPGAPAR